MDVVDTSKSTTVSDLFGETSVESDTSLIGDAIKEDALFSSLLVSLQGDLAVKESNLYNLKRLLDRDEVKKRLTASNGQFLLSNDSEILKDASTSDRFYKLYFLENSAELTGGVVDEARADLGSLGGSSIGQPVVSLTMSSDGSRSWARITGSNIGERIAIVLDDKVHMAPSIREKIPGGRTQIEGFANIEEAKDIAIILRAGALPTPVEVIEEIVIGPSLGLDSISQGTRAVLIGLVFVLIFMLVYYKLGGFNCQHCTYLEYFISPCCISFIAGNPDPTWNSWLNFNSWNVY